MKNTQGREFPCFLSRENDLESVQEEYFNPRLAEEELMKMRTFLTTAAMMRLAATLTLSFLNWTLLIDRKWRPLFAKHVDVPLATKKSHAAQLFNWRTKLTAGTTVQNLNHLNWF